MRELVSMWRNTRMVVLTAMSASLYAAILIPFKVLPVIPGVTEFRPANAVPVVCSFLFGPAGAWGSAIGNVIGDFFGGIGPGSLFGFAGNFLYGFIPYKAWEALSEHEPLPRSARGWVALLLVIALASGACALVIGWGLNLLGFVPFALLANIILVNNFAVAAVLTPVLLFALYPRVRRARLRYVDIMQQERGRRHGGQLVGLMLVVASVAGGMVLGNLISSGRLAVPLMGTVASGTGALQVGVGLLPVLLLLLLGLALL
jgi:energy-coupling factor transport system substrate-specific component